MNQYNIFLCYRGESTGAIYGDALYKSIYLSDKTEDYGDLSCFFAPVCIKKRENFKQIVREVIKKTKVMVLLLTPGFFDNCVNEDDQVRYEIKAAIENKSISFLPVFFPGFVYNDSVLSKAFSEEEYNRFKHINPLFFRNIYDVNDFYDQQFLPNLLESLGINNTVRAVSRESQSRYLCHELRKVFYARHDFQKIYDMQTIIENADSVECLGISNNELTLNLGVANLRKAINRGCKITMLFLDPESKFNSIREKEEGQKEGNISSNTIVTINQAVRACDGIHHENVRLLKYDTVPRLNLIFINHHEMYLQYYAPHVEGYNNPTFIFEKDNTNSNAKNSVYDFYHSCFEILCENSIEISQEG